jgi:hypothetical protein
MAETTRSKMMSKVALFFSIVFFIAYGLASTVGSIFLVSWGSRSLFKEIMFFFLSFPVDWNRLIVEKSIYYLLLNVIFWTVIVYLIGSAVEKIVKLSIKR